MDNNDGSNSFFMAHRFQGFSLQIFLPALIYNILGLFGIFCNLVLCIVTIRNNSLRGTTNFFLALTAFFELLHQSSHPVMFYLAVSGTNFWPYMHVLTWQMQSVFGLVASQIAMLFTATDRLLQVAANFFHKQYCGKYYLAACVLICCGCGLATCIRALIFGLNNPAESVTGSLNDLFRGDMEFVFQLTLALSLCTMLTYVVVWMFIRKQAKKQNIGCDTTACQLRVKQQNARLFKCLILIVVFVSGGYMLGSAIRLFVLRLIPLDPAQNWLAVQFLGMVMNVAAAAEVPILYISSTDYRRWINTFVQSVIKRFKPERQQHSQAISSQGHHSVVIIRRNSVRPTNS